jgi:hypothetical protein
MGLDWDLHNFADFVGLQLLPENNSAVMRWTVSASENPWGSRENKHSGLELRFVGLKYLELSERDSELPMTENSCLASVSKINKDRSKPRKFRTQEPWSTGDEFCLWFQFQSGREIEIDSETVELVPLVPSRTEILAR